jgi:iron(III) transport system ATP-binding protein
MRVVLKNLTKHFGATAAVAGATFDIEARELFFLLGPSGCGKTTLLRLLAGFYQPDGGEIFFGERRMNGVPPHERNTGMVFQNYALWPHMTVAENVTYGLEVRGVPAAERRQRVEAALAMVRMQDYAKRAPNQLSGGQQQRVALARALVIRPDLILLDEPLSNLDARLRLEMREEIRRIHEQTRITTIYVTHDQKEALSMASRMAVMRQGQIEQIGPPRAVYRSPANRFVADFIGETNWLEAEVMAVSGGEMRLRTECAAFATPPVEGLAPGDRAWLGLRPEAIRIGSNGVNSFEAVIRQVTYLGEIDRYELQLSSGGLLHASEQNPVEARGHGTRLSLHVRPEDCLVLKA